MMRMQARVRAITASGASIEDAMVGNVFESTIVTNKRRGDQ